MEVAFAHFSRASAAGTIDRPLLVTVHGLLRGAALFGLAFAAFGPAYSWLLLQLLYGRAWSGTHAPALLAAYCAHVAAMSLNGVAEASAARPEYYDSRPRAARARPRPRPDTPPPVLRRRPF